MKGIFIAKFESLIVFYGYSLLGCYINSTYFRCHPEAEKFVKTYSKHKNDLVNILFHFFNNEAFESKLPTDMIVEWNARLTKTAGMCVQRKINITKRQEEFTEEVRASKIELSSKVLDSADRLRDTLVHEMCHAAAWIIRYVFCKYPEGTKRLNQ